MQAFRPFDTNNAMQQSMLGISPPQKKCDKSPSKVPINADMLYHPSSDQSLSGFKFDLQSVTCKQIKG